MNDMIRARLRSNATTIEEHPRDAALLPTRLQRCDAAQPAVTLPGARHDG
jgi:hypothetical protein